MARDRSRARRGGRAATQVCRRQGAQISLRRHARTQQVPAVAGDAATKLCARRRLFGAKVPRLDGGCCARGQARCGSGVRQGGRAGHAGHQGASHAAERAAGGATATDWYSSAYAKQAHHVWRGTAGRLQARLRELVITISNVNSCNQVLLVYIISLYYL